jgi:hypothetical protein
MGVGEQEYLPGLTFIWSARMRLLCWRVYLSLLRISTVSSHPPSG